MWLERISGGSVDLIEPEDAKAHLRILVDDFEAEITRAINASTAYLDVDEDGFGGLGFPLIQQMWASKSSSFCADVLRLPFGRVTAINEIRFKDPAGNSSVVSSANYQLTRQGRSCFVSLLPGRAWPQLANLPDAVEVRFSAGFSDVDVVPADIKSAARLLITHFFEIRQATGDVGVPNETKIAVENLVSRYRRFAA
ncbi:hypothetical protein GN241_11065 [Rhodobacteraceae bacterium IMCC1335]